MSDYQHRRNRDGANVLAPGKATTSQVSVAPGKETLIPSPLIRHTADSAGVHPGTSKEPAPAPLTRSGATARRADPFDGIVGFRDSQSAPASNGPARALPASLGERAGNGGPLPHRAEAERSFGRSFADVDAHTGMAAELAPLGAQALTVGHTVAFADAHPSPALVAHEATHVVQNEQAGAAVAMASGVVAPRDSAAEAEADTNAQLVAAHGPGTRLPPVAASPAAHIHLSPKLLVPEPGQAPQGTTIRIPDADHPSKQDIDGDQVIQTGETIEPGTATPLRSKSWKSLAQMAESVTVKDDTGDTLHIDTTYRLESRPQEVGEVPDLWIHTERKALLTIGSGEHAGATIVGQARIRLSAAEMHDPKAAIAKASIGPAHWAEVYLAEASQFVNLSGAGGRPSLLADAANNDVLAYDDPLRMLVGLKNILKQQHVAGRGGDVAKMHARALQLLAAAKRGVTLLKREMASVASYHDPHPGMVAPVRFLVGDIATWLAANQEAGRDATEDARQLRDARGELEGLLADLGGVHPPKRNQVDDALGTSTRFVERTGQGVEQVGAMVVDAVVLGVDALGDATGLGTFDYHPISKYGKSIEATGASTTTALVTMVNGFADEWSDAIERARHGDYRSLTDVSVDTLMMIDGARTSGTIALEKAEALAAKLGNVARSAHAIASTLPAEARNIAAAMGDGADAFAARLRAGDMQMAMAGGGGGGPPGPNLGGLSAETLAEAAQAAKEAFKDKRLAQAGEHAKAPTDAVKPSPGGVASHPDVVSSAHAHAIGTDATKPVGPEHAPPAATTSSNSASIRLAELASAGLDGAQLASLSTDFTEAELTTLETVMSRKQLATFYASPDMGKAGLAVIRDCAINPNIRGLRGWVDFASSKNNISDWRRMLGELREALRTLKTDPSEVVEVDTDVHSPTKTGQYSPRGTPLEAKTFDLTIKDSATGAAKRSVEVTSATKPVVNTSSIADGIAHATRKLIERNTIPVDAPGHQLGTPLPIPGAEKEVVIQVDLFHGEMDPTTEVQKPGGSTRGTFPPYAHGRKSVVFDGIGGYSYQDYVERPASAGPKGFPGKAYDGGRSPGSILDNVLRNLNMADYAKANILKRIRIVGFDGSPIALFEQDTAGVWSRK